MDRLVHTALNSVANLRDARIAQAQNLANQTVPGFRRDLASWGSVRFLSGEEGTGARAVPVENGPQRFSSEPGALRETGDPLDIALDGDGYFLVDPQSGLGPALSRRGDLRTNDQGQLTNGAGELILSSEGQPITIPPNRRMDIDELGQIRIEPMNGGEMRPVAMIGTVGAEGLDLAKGVDGQIRMLDGSDLPAPDQSGRVRQGVLESSNVDTVAEMVEMIELQRRFEMSLRLVTTAEELDESSSRLMQLPD